MKSRSQEMFRRWVRQARARYMVNGGWFGTARLEQASGISRPVRSVRQRQ